MSADTHPLTTAVRRFRAGHMTWDEFVARSIPAIHATLTRVFRCDQDVRCEVVSEFYPRLRRVVDDYRDGGAPFEAYLSRSVTNCYRSMYRRTRRRNDCEVLFCDDHDYAEEIAAPEKTSSLRAEPRPRHGVTMLRTETRTRDAVRRQMLYVLCQNVPLMDDAECERYAAMFDLPVAYVGALQSYVQQTNVERSRRRTTYRERRDRHYAAMLRCERDREQARDEWQRDRLEEQARHHREQWNYYRHRLSRQTVTLTHRDVARLLGVSKGSIDSSMAYLQARLARITGGR